jgi:hypothetical protein
MDSEGWVSISLIAGFSRLKRLTTDLEEIKRAIGFSAFLEIQDNHVRLANGQAKQFILPSAKISTVSLPLSPSQDAMSRSGGNDLPTEVFEAFSLGDFGGGGAGLAPENAPPRVAKGDVENALLRNRGPSGNETAVSDASMTSDTAVSLESSTNTMLSEESHSDSKAGPPKSTSAVSAIVEFSVLESQ